MFVEEGLVKIKIPKDYLSKKHFFNPRMELARDLTILILHTLNSRNWVVCDALAGIGIRGIRIAKDCEVKEVWINDISKDAISYMEKNMALNRVKSKVRIFNEDAKLLLVRNKRTFDYIDVDPFGSPSYFFDACAEAIKRKGLLGFSATDTAPLSGVNPLTCFRRYGIKSYRTDFFKELGLRILIASVVLNFSKWFLCFTPILSYSFHHYYRIFGKVEKKRSKTNQSLKENLAFLNYCHKCLWRKIDKKPYEKCEFCESNLVVIPNVWVGDIEDIDFIKKCLKKLDEIEWLNTRMKVRKLLLLLQHENIPFYYHIHKVCQKHKLRIPKFIELQKRLKEGGYKAERTHFSVEGIKTDAFLKDLIDSIKI
jgi:tRNA (guanine26-N2/guanine27-N2)-dimethyltransferase